MATEEQQQLAREREKLCLEQSIGHDDLIPHESADESGERPMAEVKEK